MITSGRDCESSEWINFKEMSYSGQIDGHTLYFEHFRPTIPDEKVVIIFTRDVRTSVRPAHKNTLQCYMGSGGSYYSLLIIQLYILRL